MHTYTQRCVFMYQMYAHIYANMHIQTRVYTWAVSADTNCLFGCTWSVANDQKVLAIC